MTTESGKQHYLRRCQSTGHALVADLNVLTISEDFQFHISEFSEMEHSLDEIQASVLVPEVNTILTPFHFCARLSECRRRAVLSIASDTV